MNEELQQLKKDVDELQRKLALIDFFSDKIIFNKKVKFNTTVYDKDGNIVTEINP